ncbi:MAG: phage tail protein I [Proteobacteria bacterium]|nr:phage tail protein I [Pseudomonadota bacterium]
MIEGRATPSLVPPSISDERGKAFGKVMVRAIADPDFKRLLFERIDDVDASVLPFLIREFSIEEFVEPGMSEAVIRRLLKTSYELHARKGFVDGVRTGLAMLGIRVTRWRQWFEEQPKVAPGTHVITLAIDEAVFEVEGRAITVRLQRAIGRMIDGMKRYSQDVTMRFEAEAETSVFVGAAVRSRVSIRPSVDPITRLVGNPPLFIAAAVSSRLRVSPQV